MWCSQVLLRSWVIHVIADMWLILDTLWVYVTGCNPISSVQMISAEAPVLFAKAAQIFITELTLRAWIHTEDNKRRTLQVRHTRFISPFPHPCIIWLSFWFVAFCSLSVCVCIYKQRPHTSIPLRTLPLFSCFSLHWFESKARQVPLTHLSLRCHFACSTVPKLNKMDSGMMWSREHESADRNSQGKSACLTWTSREENCGAEHESP